MAEFSEVMRQWVRVRKATASSAEEQVLSVFPLEEYDNSLIADIEKNVMRWAAEHPEPVYPTWAEWLIEKGVYTGTFIKDKPRLGDLTVDLRVTDKVYQPIDADIAQKLGIEPKEA